MKRNLLLISNSTNAGEKYLDWCKEMIAEFCKENNIKKVLFIPYAGFAQGYDTYEKKVKEVYATFGVDVYSIHHSNEPLKDVMQAECIAVGGGNTFYLVREMQEKGIMKAIREKAFAGMPYIGWSAGSNVAGLSLKTTNDMPIVETYSFDDDVDDDDDDVVVDDDSECICSMMMMMLMMISLLKKNKENTEKYNKTTNIRSI